MKKYRFLRICCVLIVTFGWLCSCDPNDETISSTTDTNTSKVTKPTFDKFLSTTDTDGFSIRVRFKTGGDKESNICATLLPNWIISGRQNLQRVN
mgnify:CR=1 FL=1